MKESVVQWLKNTLETYGNPDYCEIRWNELDELFEQAEEMEKKQAINPRMSPKEKAEELVDKFRIILMNEDTDCGNEILCTSIAIKHAKICIAEATKVAFYANDKIFDYYLNVRQELEKL